jgi:hypothetical protein
MWGPRLWGGGGVSVTRHKLCENEKGREWLLTLLCRGEENIYLDDFDVKLRKKLLCTLFF